MKSLYLLLASICAIMLTGCAHPIAIAPDVSMISRGNNPDLSPAKVGYYFPPDSGQAVITPGGGGDRVQYVPYVQLEPAFKKMLGNVFQSATPMTNGSAEEVAQKGVDYVIPLKITTDSSSPSPFTWPPTWFSVRLDSDVRDAAGRPVATLSVTGEGKAEFNEFARNHGLSGQRASFDALAKMQNALLSVPQFKNTVKQELGTAKTAATVAPKDSVDTLQKLNNLYDQGLITKEEFAEKRAKVLEGL